MSTKTYQGHRCPTNAPIPYYERVAQDLIVKGFVFIGAGVGIYLGISIAKSIFD